MGAGRICPTRVSKVPKAFVSIKGTQNVGGVTLPRDTQRCQHAAGCWWYPPERDAGRCPRGFECHGDAVPAPPGTVPRPGEAEQVLPGSIQQGNYRQAKEEGLSAQVSVSGVLALTPPN